MKVQIGAGSVRLDGFLNVDIRKVEGVDLVGDAADLGRIATGSVDVLFGNALFEHLFLGHQLAALREWKRVLAPGGLLYVLGLPDFEAIARLYLDGASGIVGERFDLLNVYRYSHGEPEHATPPVWPVWRATEGVAPSGWIPQLHKCLFDGPYVRGLLNDSGLEATLFNYSYPREAHRLNLGFIAGPKGSPEIPSTLSEIRKSLERLVTPERFANIESIVLKSEPEPAPPEGLLAVARQLDSTRPKSLWQKIQGRLMRKAPAPHDHARDSGPMRAGIIAESYDEKSG